MVRVRQKWVCVSRCVTPGRVQPNDTAALQQPILVCSGANHNRPAGTFLLGETSSGPLVSGAPKDSHETKHDREKHLG